MTSRGRAASTNVTIKIAFHGFGLWLTLAMRWSQNAAHKMTLMVIFHGCT